MSRKNKLKPGRKIKTMTGLSREIERHHFVYWRHKPQHHGWMRSMMYGSLLSAVKSGILRYAKSNNSLE